MSIEKYNPQWSYQISINNDTINLSIQWEHPRYHAEDLRNNEIKPVLEELLSQKGTERHHFIQKVVIDCSQLESFGKYWLIMVPYFIKQWRRVVFLHTDTKLINKIKTTKLQTLTILDDNWKEIPAVSIYWRLDTDQELINILETQWIDAALRYADDHLSQAPEEEEEKEEDEE